MKNPKKRLEKVLDTLTNCNSDIFTDALFLEGELASNKLVKNSQSLIILARKLEMNAKMLREINRAMRTKK